MKAQYKKIKTREKESRKTLIQDLKTIDILINLKSWGRHIYKDKEVRQQLRYILRRNKLWDYDVKNWFLSHYREQIYLQPNHWHSSHGSRYIPKKERDRRVEEIGDIPF